jgi:hypothetical protein
MQVQQEVRQVDPTHEVEWNYAAVVDAANAVDVSAAIGSRLTPLRAAAGDLQPPTLGDLPWSESVWCTRNFLDAVHGVAGGGVAENSYLRPVDALLALPNGECVLLSELEANGVLGALQSRRASGRGGTCGSALLHLSYARAAAGLLACGAQTPPWLDAYALASAQLFNGEAAYDEGEVRAQVPRLVRGRRREVEALVDMRGKTPQLPRSHLELACDV